MKKTMLLILAGTGVLMGFYYFVIQMNNQKDEDYKTVCKCRNNGIFIKRDIAFFTLNSNSIALLFHNERINYSKKSPYGKGFVISVEIPINRSSADTLYFEDGRKVLKMYDFVVDTLIVNKKQGIICDLKEVTINGKKQYARDLIILD